LLDPPIVVHDKWNEGDPMGGNGEFAHHARTGGRRNKYLIGKAKKQRPEKLLDGDFPSAPVARRERRCVGAED